MRRSLWITAAALVAMLMSSCSAMFNASSFGSNDLYNTDNRIQVANRLKAKAEAEAAEAAARQAQWEARTAQAYADAAEAEYYASINNEPNYVNIVADDYNSAYARRLYAFNSPTYNYPSTYYDLLTSSAMMYASAYDPAYYNIMVSGNQVWVEIYVRCVGCYKHHLWPLLIAMELWLEILCRSILLLMVGLSSLLVVRLELEHLLP